MLGNEIYKQLKMTDKMYKFIDMHFPLDNKEANDEIYKKLVALRKLMCEVSDKFEKERKGKPA
jgi:hypothetical protein